MKRSITRQSFQYASRSECGSFHFTLENMCSGLCFATSSAKCFAASGATLSSILPIRSVTNVVLKSILLCIATISFVEANFRSTSSLSTSVLSQSRLSSSSPSTKYPLKATSLLAWHCVRASVQMSFEPNTTQHNTTHKRERRNATW
jgi:hypothetical protein